MQRHYTGGKMQDQIDEIERKINYLTESHIKLEQLITLIVNKIAGSNIKHYMDEAPNE